jgi:hypothetical protein
MTDICVTFSEWEYQNLSFVMLNILPTDYMILLIVFVCVRVCVCVSVSVSVSLSVSMESPCEKAIGQNVQPHTW